MPFAAFTFGDATLTVVELAFMFLWIWIAIGVVFDIFRSHDLSNASKALWVLAIFVLPLLGVLGYRIVRGHTLHTNSKTANSTKRSGSSDKQLQLLVRPTISSSSPTCAITACSPTKSSTAPKQGPGDSRLKAASANTADFRRPQHTASDRTAPSR